MKREIGSTGDSVFSIGLGAMPLSLGERPDEADAVKVIHAAFNAGVNFIDTADVYCHDNSDLGHNERLIAKALAGHSDSASIIVATKGGCTRPEGRWQTDGRPKHLRQACEQSLKNLKSEQIFLYQLHSPSTGTPFETSVETLAELQSEGKIQHIGISNVSPAQLEAAIQIVRIETVQNRFNPFYKEPLENGLVELCKQHQITFIAHSPVGGFLSHKDATAHPLIASIAEKHNRSRYQVILAWLLHVAEHVLPIPGASRAASILDSSEASSLRLDSEDIEGINNL